MSLTIQLNNIGKRYIREWIFRGITLTFLPQEKWVILGANGSGKSTFLQLIASYQIPSEGEIIYINTSQQPVDQLNRHKLASLASPYLELIEDFTALESMQHQAVFKPFQQQMREEQLLELAELKHVANKQVKYFSSGMKQRLKLALAILADTPLLLLDEPLANLDKKAVDWYKQLIRQYAMHKTIIVCSNTVTDEYEFCTKQLDIGLYKLSGHAHRS